MRYRLLDTAFGLVLLLAVGAHVVLAGAEQAPAFSVT